MRKPRTKLNQCWQNIRKRCFYKKHNSYKNYGGRGIKICKEWIDGGYQVFKKWATENGYKKGLTIERINNDQDYSPSNCKWIPQKLQSKNRRYCIGIEKATLIRNSNLPSGKASQFFNVCPATIRWIRTNKIYQI